MSKLNEAIRKFDAYNLQDPNVFIWDGKSYPKEYFFALKLYDWVKKLEPDASEELLLASRSQHIGRWESPRESYPPGREAYLKWRRDLALYHAEKAGEILRETGYDEETIARVQQINLKKRLKLDREVQTMENALCLVFLEFQYEDFYPKHENEKVITILRKSLLKMDEHGHQFALTLNFSPGGMHLLKEALKLL
jgi:hypothetical protein